MSVLSRLRVPAMKVAAAQPLSRRRFACRTYGSAALMYDYDFYYEDEEETNQQYGKDNLALEESEGSVIGRGVQWVIMGDPMARRHLYADRLSKLLGVPLISMGTLVRQELHPHSSLYKQIASAVNQGKLVPEDVIFGLLSKRLEEGYSRGESGFILDGIPRTRVQAEILDQIADIDLVLNLKCTEECLLKGSLGNGIAQEFLSMARSTFNLSPDTDALWKEKLRLYAEQSKPLEDYYRKQKKLLDFQVSGAPGETWPGLLAALHLQHMNAVSSSQKLTA